MAEILISKDYNKFKFVDVNRAVNRLEVEKKKNLLVKNDKSSVLPILVTKNLEIIDGQHRFVALKELNKPIYYIIDENYCMSDVVDINSTSLRWSSADFLTYYIKQDKQNYIKFNDLLKKYSFNITELVHLVGNGESKRNPFEDFKTGNLKLKSDKDVEILCQILFNLKPFYRSTPTPMINSINFIYNNFKNVKFEKLYEKLLVEKSKKNNDEKLEAKSSIYDQILSWETIYNYKVQNQVRFADKNLLNKSISTNFRYKKLK